ncbi:MAG: tRNA pseudouridine(55) synthase TruB [Bacteroidales bacterium]|nr:tRNA pseudouridine(55) synthase TruB [Bacteroidales bacterium]
MKVIHAARFTIDENIYEQEDNIFLFDKPYQATSFDLVAKVKYAMKRKFGKKVKVGHAGTLDPLASGLMIVCTGKFTKQIDLFQSADKEYTGTIRLGATTPSFDLEKPVDAEYPTAHITPEMVRETAASFIGAQEQIPPQFSALRIDGRRAFSYARQGEEVEIKPRAITISEFEITRCELPEVDFRIVCSKGTYIRSIARDFGLALQSGGHLTALRRTRIGEFRVENAIRPTPLPSPIPPAEQP